MVGIKLRCDGLKSGYISFPEPLEKRSANLTTGSLHCNWFLKNYLQNPASPFFNSGFSALPNESLPSITRPSRTRIQSHKIRRIAQSANCAFENRGAISELLFGITLRPQKYVSARFAPTFLSAIIFTLPDRRTRISALG
jgi:hypothetical protein